MVVQPRIDGCPAQRRTWFPIRKPSFSCYLSVNALSAFFLGSFQRSADVSFTFKVSFVEILFIAWLTGFKTCKGLFLRRGV